MMNVFYLDDEPSLCDIFYELFDSEEICVTTFTDPEVAIRSALEIQPDIFFIDHRLQNMTGAEVAESLPSHIPKILVTGDLSLQPSTLFSGCINKPYENTAITDIFTKYRNMH